METNEPETKTNEPEKKKGKKVLIIAVVGVLAVAGGGAWFFLGGEPADASEAEVTEATEPVEGPVIEGDQMTVNLADEDQRYARITFAVVLAPEADSATVGERIPLLKDAILDVVSAYRAEDLRGPEALVSLRSAFTEKAHDVYAEGEVMRVAITELLVQ